MQNDIQTQLNKWLLSSIKQHATIIYMKNHTTIKARVQSKLINITNDVITSAILKEIIKLLVGNNTSELIQKKELDGVYKISSEQRFRYHIFAHNQGYSIIFRFMPSKIKTLKELHLPESLEHIINLNSGLVLIASESGHGKSSTLSSIVNTINHKYIKHIITIEDPIEYTYKDIKSIIEQKEIPTHIPDISHIAKSIAKESPDIVVIDKVDNATIAKQIIDLLSGGYMVIATIDAINTKDIIHKFLDYFDAYMKPQARYMLTHMLKATIVQKLIPNKNNEQVPLIEIMFQSKATQEMIRNQEENQLYKAIEKDSQTIDSITFEQSLDKLYKAGQITKDTVMQYNIKYKDDKDYKKQLRESNDTYDTYDSYDIVTDYSIK
jgi:twitching motility protein PilT